MAVPAYGRKTETGEWISIEAPWNTKFINQLKSDIPPKSRRWVPDVACEHPETHQRCKGVWQVAPEFETVAVEAMRMFYEEVFITNPGGSYHFNRNEA